MPRFVNPSRIVPASSRYSHGVAHSARARRLVIAGQVGARIDGSLPDDLRQQIEIAFDNLLAVIDEAGFVRTDLVRLTAYCVVPNAVRIYREVRDRKLDGHPAASTYIQVAGLAGPEMKFEIEGEAISEDPDLLFDDFNEEVVARDWSGKR